MRGSGGRRTRSCDGTHKIAYLCKIADGCTFGTVDEVNCEFGLRNRKKAATRTALADAATHLVLAFGVDGTTAEAIADRAGVSVRTFHNYFSSKEEAVLAHFEARIHGWVDDLLARPEGEPIWDSLEALALQLVDDPQRPLEDTHAMIEIVDYSPSLLVKRQEMHQRIGARITTAIATRTGTDPDRDLYPSLLNHAVGAGCRGALELWFTGKSGAQSPSDLVREAFALLRAGLPEPGRPTP